MNANRTFRKVPCGGRILERFADAHIDKCEMCEAMLDDVIEGHYVAPGKTVDQTKAIAIVCIVSEQMKALKKRQQGEAK